MDYTTMQRTISDLKKQCPAVQIDVFGSSVLERPLYRLRIGTGERKLLLAAAFHGMEHITTDLLLRYGAYIGCRRLCAQIDLIPMMNPDGVEIHCHGWQWAGKYAALVRSSSKGNTSRWQANAKGVDLNHNFDADWQNLRRREIAAGITGPGPTRFGGTHPESEPESHALAQLCRKEQYTAAAALHTQGEEIYWNFGAHTPPQSYAIAVSMARASGYTAAEPEGLAVGGGFKDWFIEEFRRPAFTIEAGKGRNPLPMSQLDEIYARVQPLLDRLCTV